MLILILSENLKIQFISPGAVLPFGPFPADLNQPIELANGLMEVDPQLPLDCRAVLQGEIRVHRDIGNQPQGRYRRRVMLRKVADGQANELVVVYEASQSAVWQELAQLRQQLDDVLDAVQDPIAYYDRHDCLVHYNKAYANFHNRDATALTAGTTFEGLLRHDLETGLFGIPITQHDDWLRDRLAQRQDQMFEEIVQLCDGRWLRVTQRMTAGGAFVHMLVDITDIKNAQSDLKQVISGSRAAVWSVNLDTGNSNVNDYWAELLGLDQHETASMGFEGWRALVHPDDVAMAESGFVRCASGSNAPFETEYRMRHTLGHWVWVLGRGGVSGWHADGRPFRISGVLMDISQQKRLEEELALRATAVSETKDGITITDKTNNIIYTNSTHAAMFGNDDQTTLIGQPWKSLYAPQEAAKLVSEAFPALRKHGYWKGYANALRKDGTTFEQELSLTSMPGEKIVCVSRDVTEANSVARERLRIRDQFEKAQRREIVNLLAAGLTHDLMNLIATISYSSDPAFVEAGVQLPDAIKSIHTASKQAIALLAPIRNLGIGNNVIQRIDLNLLLREVASVLQLGASPWLQVLIDLPDEPTVATVNPIKLMQVLLNIGFNGRDALSQGEQRLTLALSCNDTIPEECGLEVGHIPQAPYALCKISDTGSGIAPDVRARLWEPHFTTKGNMGTGLGLPVVAEIVKAAGGGVALRTTLGEGSTFYIAWPLCSTAAA